jgi:hypothetical protein
MVKERGGARRMAALILLGLAVGSTGCGLTVAQKEAIGQFSRATAAVGQTTSDELAKMREGVIQANTSTLIILGQDRPPPGETSPRAALITPLTVERQFTIQNISRIGYAARALQSYGELLQGLVEDTQAKELRGAAEAFVANLQAMPDVSLGEKEADAIAGAVYTIGRMLVEMKKAEAVKTIVPTAAPHVEKITGLLAVEFDPNRDGSLASAYRAAAERLRGESATAFREAKTVADRAMILPAWEYGRRASLRSEEIHARSSHAVAGIQKSHKLLVEAVTSDRWTAEDVKAIVTEFDKELKAVAKLTTELLERSKLLQ